MDNEASTFRRRRRTKYDDGIQKKQDLSPPNVDDDCTDSQERLQNNTIPTNQPLVDRKDNPFHP
jgi:hypothetical protein